MLLPYRMHLRGHLAHYKREVLGVVEEGTWRYRGQDLKYSHILPSDQQRLNIVECVRDEFWMYWEDQKRHVRPANLHRDFAHLTSSQALAFNVFFPFLGSSRAAPSVLLDALGVSPEPVTEWRFEEVLDVHEGTNFDVAITLASGHRVLVEVKLTESRFGKCPDDTKHRRKLADIYTSRLTGKVTETAICASTFFNRYQILRNISYANETTTVVFLVPEANEALRDDIEFIHNTVLEAYRPTVRVLYLEELLGRLVTEPGGPFAADLTALVAKYIPLDPVLQQSKRIGNNQTK